jgi:hypothetical protein
VKHWMVDYPAHSDQLRCFFQYCKTFSRPWLGLEAAFLIAGKTHLFPLELSNCAKNSSKQVLELLLDGHGVMYAHLNLPTPAKQRSRA